MSFMYYDGSIMARMEHNMATSMYRRFVKYWPTETLVKDDGSSVLVYSTNAPPFYVNDYIEDEVIKRFVQRLGISWPDFKQSDVDGEIETMYFKLKGGFNYSGKVAYGTAIPGTAKHTAPDSGRLATFINETFENIDLNYETIDVTISYGGGLKRYVKEHSLGWVATGTGITTTPLNTEEIRGIIHSNPWYYLANSRHAPYVDNNLQFQLYDGSSSGEASYGGRATPSSTPVCTMSSTVDELGVLAVLDDGSVFEPVLDDNGDIRIFNEEIKTKSPGKVVDGGMNHAGSIIDYRYTIKYKFKTMMSPSVLATRLISWYDVYNPSVDKWSKKDITSQIDTKIKHALISMMYDEAATGGEVENSLYVGIPDDIVPEGRGQSSEATYTWYTKVDAIRHMRKREFAKWLSTSLDTGYTVEAKEWWEGILAVVIIIIAVIIAVWSVGGASGISSALASTALGSTTTMIATFAGTLALSLTVGSMIMSEVGGLSSRGLVKIIGQFAAIAGMVATVAGIYAGIQAMASRGLEAARAQAGTEAAKAVLKEVAVSQMSVTELLKYALQGAVETVKTTFTELAMNSASMSMNSVVEALSWVNKGFNFYTDEEKKQMDKEISEAEAEIDKYNEEVLNRPYTQVAGVFIMAHEKLATPDMLQDLALDIQSKVGQDVSFQAWSTDVNS